MLAPSFFFAWREPGCDGNYGIDCYDCLRFFSPSPAVLSRRGADRTTENRCEKHLSAGRCFYPSVRVNPLKRQCRSGTIMLRVSFPPHWFAVSGGLEESDCAMPALSIYRRRSTADSRGLAFGTAAPGPAAGCGWSKSYRDENKWMGRYRLIGQSINCWWAALPAPEPARFRRCGRRRDHGRPGRTPIPVLSVVSSGSGRPARPQTAGGAGTHCHGYLCGANPDTPRPEQSYGSSRRLINRIGK